MSHLKQKIIEKIKKDGPLRFSTFMEMALYYPGMGYYSSPEITIGRRGDFYTSPHLHPAFGAMLSRQIVEFWRQLGKPSIFHAIEIGAGLGHICKDIFNYLEITESIDDKESFLKALNYVIVEPYDHFEDKQRALIIDPPDESGKTTGALRAENIRWIKSLDELEAVTGCILSNELLDAFPVHIIDMEDELKEVCVGYEQDRFIEVKQGPVSKEIKEYIDLLPLKLPAGYRTEINLSIKKWIRDAAKVISEGYLLTIDYGYSAEEYYSAERSTGTLLCYYQHRYNDNPYDNIGKQDITAHVNFSSLKLWGEEAGFNTVGYCPQGTYLTALGIDEMITELYLDSPNYISEISKIKGLIMPEGMGLTHNVMIQHKGKGLPELKGFSMRNNVSSL